MIRPHWVLLFLLWPLSSSLVNGHGCSFFRLADDDLRARFQSNDQVPDKIKEFVNGLGTSAIPFGVYDCHNGTEDYEVGYSAACVGNGTCLCTALYNFQECQSCSLSCGADINFLDIGDFQADCTNVKTPISSTCSVDCNYTTYDCFVGDPRNTNATTTSTAVRAMPFSLLWTTATTSGLLTVLSLWSLFGP
ncbi:hypothetical protein ACA910_022611 [Epithemia clementina (nom. ined.)]